MCTHICISRHTHVCRCIHLYTHLYLQRGTPDIFDLCQNMRALDFDFTWRVNKSTLVIFSTRSFSILKLRVEGFVVTHCNTLQHTATYGNALQHNATHAKATRRRMCGVVILVETNWCGVDKPVRCADEIIQTHIRIYAHTQIYVH